MRRFGRTPSIPARFALGVAWLRASRRFSSTLPPKRRDWRRVRGGPCPPPTRRRPCAAAFSPARGNPVRRPGRRRATSDSSPLGPSSQCLCRVRSRAVRTAGLGNVPANATNRESSLSASNVWSRRWIAAANSGLQNCSARRYGLAAGVFSWQPLRAAWVRARPAAGSWPSHFARRTTPPTIAGSSGRSGSSDRGRSVPPGWPLFAPSGKPRVDRTGPAASPGQACTSPGGLEATPTPPIGSAQWSGLASSAGRYPSRSSAAARRDAVTMRNKRSSFSGQGWARMAFTAAVAVACDAPALRFPVTRRSRVFRADGRAVGGQRGN